MNKLFNFQEKSTKVRFLIILTLIFINLLFSIKKSYSQPLPTAFQFKKANTIYIKSKNYKDTIIFTPVTSLTGEKYDGIKIKNQNLFPIFSKDKTHTEDYFTFILVPISISKYIGIIDSTIVNDSLDIKAFTLEEISENKYKTIFGRIKVDLIYSIDPISNLPKNLLFINKNEDEGLILINPFIIIE